MKPDPLESLLTNYAAQPVPPARADAAGVWREIERRRGQNSSLRLFAMVDWRELFAEPRLALLAVVLAVVVGSVPGFWMTRDEAPAAARTSLHMESFSAASGDLLAQR